MSYNAGEVCGGIQTRGEAKQFVEDTNQNQLRLIASAIELINCANYKPKSPTIALTTF